MNWRFGFAAAALILQASVVRAAPAEPAAPAQEPVPDDLTVVGKFYADDGHSVLYVLTSKPGGKLPKGAVVGVEFENAGADYRYNGTYSRLQSTFLSAAEWRKFVALWKQARSGVDSKDDNYFDGETELLVGPTHDGLVSFSLAGNGQVDNHPKDMTFFILPAKDVLTLDRDVKRVTAYFAK